MATDVKIALSDATYTGDTYADQHPDYHLEDSPEKARYIRAFLERNKVAAEAVCEIGCGGGGVLASLAFPDGHGYDISPRAIKLAETLQSERLRFHCGDLLSMDTPQYDLALCVDVIEHIPDAFAFLRAFRAKGKLKLFVIPLELSAQAVVRGKPMLRAWREVGHIHSFTKDLALELLRDCDYHIHSWEYKPRDCGTLRSAVARVMRSAAMAVAPDVAVRLLGGYCLLVLAE